MIQTLSSQLQSATVIQHEFHLFSLIFLVSYILLCINIADIIGYQVCLKLAIVSHTSGHLPKDGQLYTWIISLQGSRMASSIFPVSRERWEHFCHQLYFITATFHCLPVSLIIFSLNKMRIILPFSEEIFLIYIGVREHFEKSNYRSYFTVLCCCEMTVQPK